MEENGIVISTRDLSPAYAARLLNIHFGMRYVKTILT
jgi:hypothetical protein